MEQGQQAGYGNNDGRSYRFPLLEDVIDLSR
jgi:hypothetical protein